MIALLFNQEQRSMRYIAQILARSVATISRELQRNFDYESQQYDYEIAESKSINRSYHKYSFRLVKYRPFINFFYQHFERRYHGVNLTYLLAKEHLLEVKVPSLRQLYNWIKKRRFKITKKHLTHPSYYKGRRRKKGLMKKIFDHYIIPIGVRPASINQRSEIRHWEIDLVMGGKIHGNQHLLTMVDRKSRYGFIKKVPSKNDGKVLKALRDLIKIKHIPVKSLTMDNGIEFAPLGILAKEMNFKIYACESYCSFQRGTNENFNGLIRRTWKKQTRFNNISNEAIQEVQELINLMPRPMFNYKSASEIYFQR